MSTGYNSVFIIAGSFLFFALLIPLLSQDLKRLAARTENGFKALSIEEAFIGLREWRVIAVSIVGLSREFVAQGVMSTVFQLYLNTNLSMSVDLVGYITGSRALGMIFASLISGGISDRIGRKPVIAGGLLVEAICLYSYTLASTFEMFIVLTVLGGFGSAFVFTSATVFIADLVPLSSRSGAVGLYRTFLDIGGILGPISFMFAYSSVHAHFPFWTSSLLYMFNIPLIWLVRRQKFPEEI